MGKNNGKHYICCETEKKSCLLLPKHSFCYVGYMQMTAELLNPLNAKLNPICHLLALLGAHRILHVSRIRVKALSQNYFRGCFETWKDSVEWCVALKGIPHRYHFVNNNFWH